MSKIKIKVSNSGSKTTQYHYLASQGTLSPGSTKDVSINIGDTLYFENDGGIKYKISESDKDKTFYYSK